VLAASLVRSCVWLFLLTSGSAFAGIQPVKLLCESKLNPLGLSETSPRLSWQDVATVPGERGQFQSAYQIQVASSLRVLANNQSDLWDTGQVATNQASQIMAARRTVDTPGWSRPTWQLQSTGRRTARAYWTARAPSRIPFRLMPHNLPDFIVRRCPKCLVL
jgi:hypothetical protein